MIQVSDSISIDDAEIELSFIRSSGPGGQHVNKTSTGVQLRFDAGASPALTPGIRARLKGIAGSRMTADGVLIITATEFRSQKANREAAIARLIEMIRAAEKKPKRRTKTKPTRASKVRRVEHKKRRGEIKRGRGSVRGED